ncbi:MAG: hypothetical protein IKA36_02695 [Clostridia bacterium]|nr:hypothetical protein [Clostridia bacterium]
MKEINIKLQSFEEFMNELYDEGTKELPFDTFIIVYIQKQLKLNKVVASTLGVMSLIDNTIRKACGIDKSIVSYELSLNEFDFRKIDDIRFGSISEYIGAMCTKDIFRFALANECHCRITDDITTGVQFIKIYETIPGGVRIHVSEMRKFKFDK